MITNSFVHHHPLGASIVKKQVMALTGLMMAGFLLIHLAGNLLMFRSPEVFNQYAFQMLNNPIIIFLEWVLALLFLCHALLGFLLIVENRKARPVRYKVRFSVERGSALSFASMSLTGPLMLIFLVMHLVNFKYGTNYTVVQGDIEIRDLYRTVIEYYSVPLNVVLYMLAMCAVALHLQHGVWSAFQSFGLNHPHYNRLLEIGSNLYALIILLGFIVIPLFFSMQEYF